jgi:hypothetical protein
VRAREVRVVSGRSRSSAIVVGGIFLGRGVALIGGSFMTGRGGRSPAATSRNAGNRYFARWCLAFGQSVFQAVSLACATAVGTSAIASSVPNMHIDVFMSYQPHNDVVPQRTFLWRCTAR